MWRIHRKVKSSHKKQLTLEEERTLDHIIFGFTGISVFVTLLSGTILFSSNFNTHADNVSSSNVAVNVANYCTMSGVVTSSHSRTLTGGSYTTGIGSTTLTTFCNDPNGFVIYTIGAGDGADPTEMVSSVGNTYNIVTGLNTDINPGDGKSNWAMRLDAISNAFTPTIHTDYDSKYGIVPSTYTPVATLSSGTEIPYGTASTVGSQLTTTYSVYLTSSQPAGTYIGKVKYTMLHPSSANQPRTLEQSLANTLGALDAENNPNVITVDSTKYYKMQNTAANWDTICANATIINTTATLADTRDNQLYTVAKTVDNKCWMTKNLNIAGGTALSSTDTDFDSTYELPTTNGWTVADSKLVLPASNPSGFGTDNYAYAYNNNSTTCADNVPCYSYYSWDTATVGSGRTITTDNTDAPYSMCPKGWHLPNTRGDVESDSSSDFRYLMYALGGVPTIQTYDSTTNPTGATIYNKLAAQPFGFLRGGRYLNGTFYNGGSYGYYWSATSYSSTGARNLSFSSSYVLSANDSGRRYGFSVRCLAGSH